MEVKINLNEPVKFKLTDYGKDIYYHQFDELNERIVKFGGRPIEPRMPRVDNEGYTEMQLWCFMELYGKYMQMGFNNNVLEHLEIIYEMEENESKWVPVSERLPESDGVYLCSYDLGRYCYDTIGTYGFSNDLYSVDDYNFSGCEGKKGFYDYDSEVGYFEIDCITAWMPLPEPYRMKGEEDEQNNQD